MLPTDPTLGIRTHRHSPRNPISKHHIPPKPLCILRVLPIEAFATTRCEDPLPIDLLQIFSVDVGKTAARRSGGDWVEEGAGADVAEGWVAEDRVGWAGVEVVDAVGFAGEVVEG